MMFIQHWQPKHIVQREARRSGDAFPFHSLRCDGCLFDLRNARNSTCIGTRKRVREFAVYKGWREEDGKDYCPACWAKREVKDG